MLTATMFDATAMLSGPRTEEPPMSETPMKIPATVPGAVGVPVIAPVVDEKVSPGGSVPLLVNLGVPVPPEMVGVKV
jgi:hypothetical protein